MRAVAVIAARYDSTRFPGKMLANFAGKPILAWAMQTAGKLDFVSQIAIVASDKKTAATADYCNSVYLPFEKQKRIKIHTIDGSCAAEKVYKYYLVNTKADYYISIPADEPLLDYYELNKIWPEIEGSLKKSEIGTLYTKFYCKADLESHLSCKIVSSANDHMLYSSRAIVPIKKNGEQGALSEYKKHVGVFVFPHFYLERYGAMLWSDWTSFSDKYEGLEQNRFVELGSRVRLYEIKHVGFGIDVPKQVRELEKRLAKTL